MWRIPLSDLNFDETEKRAVADVLDSGWLTMGPRTQEFETWFASHHQSGNAVAVANCTCALELSMRYVLQNSPAERRFIVVPDITFVATANTVISAGGMPLLCDIDSPERPYLSLSATAELLRTRTDIAGVALVHYAGHDAGAEAMAELCDQHDVALIEDCAHSPGALTASCVPLGTFGLASCFSFFSNKNMATGEGGMLLTDDENLRDFARLGRSHGVTSGTWSRHLQEQPDYDVKFPGHNYRCTEITAALGLAQLEKLPASNARRRELTARYADLLADDLRYQVLLPPTDQTNAACHILSLLCKSPELKARVIQTLSREEIQTSHHYPPIHTFSWYRDNIAPVSPSSANANEYASRQITLPLYPGLLNEQVAEITEILRAIPA